MKRTTYTEHKLTETQLRVLEAMYHDSEQSNLTNTVLILKRHGLIRRPNVYEVTAQGQEALTAARTEGW